MAYIDFIRAAILEDSRNKFGESNVAAAVPESLTSFYRWYNPVDVEVTYPNLGAVKFCPAEDLVELQKDYDLPKRTFAFATCNGDPIFLWDGIVYLSIPEQFFPEQLARGFEEFLELYVSSSNA